MNRRANGQSPCHDKQEDVRCCCGKLLARLTNDGLVIRCARCKREMVIDMADLIVNLDTGWSEITLKEKPAAH